MRNIWFEHAVGNELVIEDGGFDGNERLRHYAIADHAVENSLYRGLERVKFAPFGEMIWLSMNWRRVLEVLRLFEQHLNDEEARTKRLHELGLKRYIKT